MNGMKKILTILLSALVVMSMAACTDTADNGSSIGGTDSSVSSEPNEASSEVSRESSELPEASLPASSASEVSDASSEGVAAPASGEGEKLTTLAVGSAEFQALFLKNEIDEQFSADFDAATSQSLLGDVIYDATEGWRKMVSVAYEAALESSATEDRRGEVQTLYNTYLDKMQAGLTDAEALSETDAVAGALAVMNQYRTCAAELCNLNYENNQTLPSFDLSEAGGAAG